MKIKKTYITNRFGEKLETHIKWDGKKNKYPTVIFISGFGMNLHEANNSFDEIAGVLAENGYLTIQFSFAGIGNSQGIYADTSSQRQAQEIKDVFSEIIKNPQVDKNRVGLISQSMGVPATISALPLPINSLIFICGVVHPLKSLEKVFLKREVKIDFKGETKLPRSDGSFTVVRPKFWKAITNDNFIMLLSKYTYPLLVIHGSLDDKISETEAKEFVKNYMGESKLRVFKKGNHGFLEVDKQTRRDFLKEIVNWLNETLKNSHKNEKN